MKLNVFLSPVIVDELYFTGKTTVVIDVLRATSTIATAIDNGAKEVVPVASVEFAVKVSGGMFGGQTLLGGERNTKKLKVLHSVILLLNMQKKWLKGKRLCSLLQTEVNRS